MSGVSYSLSDAVGAQSLVFLTLDVLLAGFLHTGFSN